MTLEQDRARLAYADVQSIAKGEQELSKVYATVVHELTTLLHTAGLVQALECVAAYSNDNKQKMGSKLLDQVARQAKRVSSDIHDGKSLRDVARKTENLQEYMHLGRELLACLVWYRRCIQSILKINPTAAAAESED